MPMASCTLTDLIASRTCILTSVDIMSESKNFLRKRGVPENNGKKGGHNEVGAAVAGLPQWIWNHLHPGISPLPVPLL